MPDEIDFVRLEYEHRADVLADHVDALVGAVLGTIDEPAARASPEKWAIVCRYFAGCATAARLQRGAPRDGGGRIADHLGRAFPYRKSNHNDDGSRAGFEEMMDWMTRPERFRPTELRTALDRAG